MSLPNTPFFEGKITVTAANKNIDWEEYNGGSPNNFNVDVDEGTYYITELLAEIKSKMDGTGAITWTWELNRQNGVVTVEGDAEFRLNLTSSESNRLLTGGDVDSNGLALYDEQAMPDALGWVQQSSYPAFGDSVEAPFPCGHCWAPSEPPIKNNLEDYNKPARASRAIDGSAWGETWADWIVDRDKYDYPGGKLASWLLSFEFLTVVDRFNFIRRFWGPYASDSEATFRFYEKWDDTQTAEYVLSEESRQTHGFKDRAPDFPHWPLDLELWRQ